MLNTHIETVLKYQTRVESFDPDDENRGELEKLCITTKARLKALLKGLTPATQAVVPIAAPRTRLPHLALPKFSGKYSEFKNFISLFESLVHNDTTIPAIEKFNHLISCLSGEALATDQPSTSHTMHANVSVSNKSTKRRPQRQRGTDTGPRTNRRPIDRDASRRGPGLAVSDLLKSMASCLVAQATVLAAMVQGVHSGTPSQEQVAPSHARRRRWRAGELVVAEDNLPPQNWLIGRVTAVHRGEDGAVRVVDLRTATGGVFRRPIHKLARLPIG
ncbi:hypothetical protein ACLKA6_013067 [Drosophila palustris]